MDNKITYHEQNDIDNTLKLREVLKTLPPFCRDYFRAIDATTTTKTRISYAYDIRIFFQFLLEQNPMFKDKTMSDFTVDVLDQVKAVDLEEYEEFLKVYKSADSSKTETNGERGVKRKISALRSFYAYYYKHEMITTNPSVLIDVPKIHDKNIIRLDTDEVAMLLDYIEHCGDTLTGQKRMYHEKTKDRDLAIVTLLLGTGIRVSECVVDQHMFVIRFNSTSGKTSVPVIVLIRCKCCRKLFPAYHIRCHTVPPVHRSPLPCIWIILVKQMDFSIVNGKTVRIIDPSGRCRDMKQRSGIFIGLCCFFCLICSCFF